MAPDHLKIQRIREIKADLFDLLVQLNSIKAKIHDLIIQLNKLTTEGDGNGRVD